MDRAPHDPVDEAVEVSESVEASDRPAIEGGIVDVAIASLTAHPSNAAIYGDDADEALVASIRDFGVTTPIEVTADGVVISGHRRISASRQAGLETIPAFVRHYPTDEAEITAMIRANQYRRKTRDQLTREVEAGLANGKGVREISGIVGASKSTVAEIASGVRTRTPGQVGPTKGRDGRNYPARVAKPSRGDQSEEPAPRGSPPKAQPTLAHDTRPSFDFGSADAVTDGPGPWRNRIVGHASRKPKSLVPNPYGQVEPFDFELDMAWVTLEKIGWFLPVIVNQVTGHIIDGHSRVTMAITRGESLVPVMYLDLSLEEERRVRDFFDGIENDVPNRRPVIGPDDPGATVDDDPGDDTGHGPTDEDEDEDGSQLGHLEPMEIDPID